MKFIITEIIGAMAYIALALSYFKKQKKGILLVQIISYLLFVIHYFLLDGITGAICNMLGLVALVVIYFFDKYQLKNKKVLIVAMILVLVAISLITYQDIFSIFPIFASSFTISSFLTSKERIIRGIGIVSTACWLVYAVALHSPITFIFEVLTLLFVLGAFVKNEKKA